MEKIHDHWATTKSIAHTLGIDLDKMLEDAYTKGYMDGSLTVREEILIKYRTTLEDEIRALRLPAGIEVLTLQTIEEVVINE